MKAKELFNTGLNVASAIVAQVDNRHFSNVTPCSEWNLEALLNHMLYELSWAPDLLAGKTIKEVGSQYEGELFGSEHLKALGQIPGMND